MSKITWDGQGERLYETGVDHGVLYILDSNGVYGGGVAWNGLTTITESPSGAEANAIYADNIKYLNLYSAEEFGCTIEAYTYPDEFAECDGSATLATGAVIGQQPRKVFGLCYRTKLGNDVNGDSHGYKLHLIYGCQASPSEKAYQTINDSPEAITFSWEVNTTPVNVTGHNPTANVTIDSTAIEDETKLATLEAILYGADEFSTTKSYAAGDVVIYGESSSAKKTYMFNKSHAAGAWAAGDADLISNVVGPQMPLPDTIATILG